MPTTAQPGSALSASKPGLSSRSRRPRSERWRTRHGCEGSTLDGMSCVTMLPAPMVTSSPIVTPGMTIVLPPIQALLPICIGLALVRYLARLDSGVHPATMRSEACNG